RRAPGRDRAGAAARRRAGRRGGGPRARRAARRAGRAQARAPRAGGAGDGRDCVRRRAGAERGGRLADRRAAGGHRPRRRGGGARAGAPRGGVPRRPPAARRRRADGHPGRRWNRDRLDAPRGRRSAPKARPGAYRGRGADGAESGVRGARRGGRRGHMRDHAGAVLRDQPLVPELPPDERRRGAGDPRAAGGRMSRAPIRVGVAGWDYRDWKGVVYPEKKPRGFDPVRYLAQFLDLIEINSTFYRPVRPEVAERWAERVEDLEGFRYSAKLWRRFTHERGEPWTTADVRAVRDGMRPLHRAKKLDALLVQFPWSFKNEESSREWLADLVRAFREFPLVVEVRHESWNEPEFY